MTKTELLKIAANKAGEKLGRSFTQTDMAAALDAICDTAAVEILGGGDVTLPGIGRLYAKATAARKGRNPRTGEVIEIPAGKKLAISVSREFRDALRGEE